MNYYKELILDRSGLLIEDDVPLPGAEEAAPPPSPEETAPPPPPEEEEPAPAPEETDEDLPPEPAPITKEQIQMVSMIGKNIASEASRISAAIKYSEKNGENDLSTSDISKGTKALKSYAKQLTSLLKTL
jgi:hypothetical protein